MNFANLSQEGVLAKEMYLHFGYAVYLSQVFEKGVASLLHGFIARENKGKLPYEKFLEEAEKLNKHTLGKLLEKVKSRISIEPEVESIIQEALERRNFLIHHYFNDNAAKATVTDGQKVIIDDLIKTQKVFEQAFYWVNNLNRELIKKTVGVSEFRMMQITEELRLKEIADFRKSQFKSGF